MNVPKKIIKRVKIDNFVAGLIFGAIFSLVVNVVTIQIQETIQKQRILEALENEIVSNLIQAKNKVKEYDDNANPFKKISWYYTIRDYTRDLWTQSSEPLQYVAQLDAVTQSKVGTYYSIAVPYANQAQERNRAALNRLLDGCYDMYSSQVKKELEQRCNDEFKAMQYAEVAFPSRMMQKESFELLKIFHPTADRLNDPFLRLIMGSKSTRILSGH